jgi:mono/diheme cytochrome c family protein
MSVGRDKEEKMYFRLAFMTACFLPSLALSAPLYTAAEAERGEALYNSKCASCHGRNLVSRGDPPSLTGEPFTLGWVGKSVGDRFAAIKETMPPNDAGNLPDEAVRDIIAYVLKFNGFESGSKPLPSSAAELSGLKIEK